MPSQFEKRKSKSLETVAKEIEQRRADKRASADEVFEETPVFTQEGYDVFTSDGGKSYHVAEIVYNPETGKAEVTAIFDISRLIALTYANQKTALGTLKRKAKKNV